MCSALFSVEMDSCSFCGSAVNPIEDVVEHAIDHALRRDASVEILRSEEAESSLMNAGGMGAFLRTRRGTILAS
jgi:peptide subunit release factor 1 (eRF1)